VIFANRFDPDEAPQNGPHLRSKLLWHSDYKSANILDGEKKIFAIFERKRPRTVLFSLQRVEQK